jgi:hypothetical protein
VDQDVYFGLSWFVGSLGSQEALILKWRDFLDPERQGLKKYLYLLNWEPHPTCFTETPRQSELWRNVGKN